tara:strand:- start:543 stop:752 length:210 start_codon:yes stop_codon:yes gene_type:complete
MADSSKSGFLNDGYDDDDPNNSNSPQEGAPELPLQHSSDLTFSILLFNTNKRFSQRSNPFLSSLCSLKL